MPLDAKYIFLGPGFFVLIGLATLIFTILRPKSWRTTLLAHAAMILALVFYFSSGPISWLGPYLIKHSNELALHPPTSDCTLKFPVIIVLGGGMHTPEFPSMAAHRRLFQAARLLIRLGQEDQSREVILTGGPTLSGSKVSEAMAAEAVLRAEVGPVLIQKHKIFQERRSLNTHENALYSAQLAAQSGMPMDAVLVTSDLHMPRAAAAFKKQGFNVCAFPTTTPKSTQLLSLDNGAQTFMLLNELFGGIVYRLRGRA